MPLIDDIIKKKSNKFVRKEYRPWDDLPLTTDSNENEEVPVMSPLTSLTSPEEKMDDCDVDKIHLVVKETKLSLVTEDTENSIRLGDAALNIKNIQDYAISNKKERPLDLNRYARGLYGLQRIMLRTIIEHISHCEGGFGFSKPLVHGEVADSMKVPINSVKGSLQRLRGTGIIEVCEFKPGRGGYSCYKLREEDLIFFQNHFNKSL